MAYYLDNFGIDHSKITKKLEVWKTELKEKVEAQIPPSYKSIKKFLIIGSISLIILGILFLILFFVVSNFTFLILMIISFVCAGIGGIIIIFKILKLKKMIAIILDEYIGEQNMFAIWFSEIFNHEEISDLYKESFATQNKDIEQIINKYKYSPAGQNNIGVIEAYNIMGGKIFNNPFNLACGIYHSYTETETTTNGNKTTTRTDYYEYMPILQVKTNSFKNLDLSVTNSRIFDGYQKNKLKFDNMIFRKKFYVKSNNDVESLMIFTPLIQEKWVDGLTINSKFQMHIHNGVINLLFTGGKSKENPFMNIQKTFSRSINIDSFLSKIDKGIMNDFDVFSQMINYVFAISYFQWEDATDDKIPEITSRSEDFINNIKSHLE